MMVLARIAGFVSAVLLVGAPALADEAQQLFDQIYRDKIKQARASVDKGDDLTLARSMLDAARDATGEPKLLALLCGAVVDLTGRLSESHDLAIEALKLQQDHVPGSRPACRTAMVEILTRQLALSTTTPEQKSTTGESLISLYGESADDSLARGESVAALADLRQALIVAGRVKSPRAGDLKMWMESVEHRQRMERRVADLRQRLLAKADDAAAANECATILLVDLDNPKQAEPLLSQASDATLKKFVPLAAQPVEKVTAADALALGEWYKQLADAAAPPAKERTYIRAETWLRSFLSLYSENDLKRKRVELLVKEASMAASKVFFAQSPPPRGLVLLYSFDEDTIVERSGKRFVADLSGGRNDLLIKDQKLENGLSGAAMVVGRHDEEVSSIQPVSVSGGKPRSLSVWIKGDEPDFGYRGPLAGWGSDGNYQQFHFGTFDGTYQVWCWGRDWGVDIRRVKGEWEHHVITFDGKLLRWYHNGKAYPKPDAKPLQTGNTPLRITRGIGGLLDEVAVYNRELTPAEVAYLHANSRRGLRYGYAK